MHSDLRARNPPAMRNGGLNCLLRHQLDEYFSQIARQTDDLTINLDKITKKGQGLSVVNFYKAVKGDPTLKMCIEAGLREIPPGGGLHQCSFEHMCRRLVCIIVTPPRCRRSALDGVPFSALFVDLLQTDGGMAFFMNPKANFHLKNMFDEYADMLESPASLKYVTNCFQGGWLFQEEPKHHQDRGDLIKPSKNRVDYTRFQCDPNDLPHYGFKSWMDWFSRKIKPEKNTLPANDNQNMIVSSSDSFPLYYPIPPLPQGRNDEPHLGSNPTYNVKMDTPFWLKDNQYSLIDMFAGQKMEQEFGKVGFIDFIRQNFQGGTVFQSYLNPWCYHRWQSPISGHIKHSYSLGGTYYLKNPSHNSKQGNNYVDSQPMLSAVSARQVFIIEAENKNIGHMAVIEVGMTQVSSVRPTVHEGDNIKKGAQLGYFAFGGSSYVLVFSNKLKKSEKHAKKGQWYLRWAKDLFKLVIPDGPNWQYELPAPGKILVNEEVCSIVQRQ